MEDIEKLEKISIENTLIAREEMKSGKQLKITVKAELKRTKVRLNLVKNELEVALNRQELAAIDNRIIDAKIKSKKERLIDASEEELKKDKEMTVYNEKVAENQIKVAEINKKIAIKEEEIAKEKISLAKVTIELAKIRLIYVKKIEDFIKTYKADEPADKIQNAAKIYIDKHDNLVRERKELFRIKEIIQKEQNQLANLKKEVGNKVSERYNIRHPGVDINPPSS